MNKRKNGMTILELLVGVFIGMIIITTSIPALSSFFSRMEIHNAISTITTSLSQARYNSLSQSRKVRIRFSNRIIHLQIKKNRKWRTYESKKIRGNVDININSSPVFNPKGYATPMCSIKISNNHYTYIISISFAGRIKIKKIW